MCVCSGVHLYALRPILEMEAGSRCGGGEKGRTLAVFGRYIEKQVDSVCL